MDRDELLRMLDIKTPAQVKGPEVVVIDETGEEPVWYSDTVLAVTGWDEVQGSQLCAENQKLELAHSCWVDCFVACFNQQPEFLGCCSDVRRQLFFEQLMGTSDYQALHETTRGNLLASRTAALQIASQFADLLAKDDQEPQGGSDREGELASLLAAGRALRAATSEVDQQEGAMNALGLGGDGGDDKGRLDTAKLAEVFKRVKNSQRLKKICEAAGRFIRSAVAKQRQKVKQGYDDMVGVELSGDVGRLLPLELAKLVDEDYELDTMRRLVERQTMCREYHGVEKQDKGPIVVCVDESGSMGVREYEPVCNAKAFALAMARIARMQKRWCCLVGYSGGTEGTWLCLPPGNWDELALADWLEHFFGGGTTMDVPLAELPNNWEKLGVPRGKTDVVLITDAIVDVPETMRQTFNAWKKRETVRCVGLVLGRSPGELESVCDEVHCVREIGVGEAAIQSCFGV